MEGDRCWSALRQHLAIDFANACPGEPLGEIGRNGQPCVGDGAKGSSDVAQATPSDKLDSRSGPFGRLSVGAEHAVHGTLKRSQGCRRRIGTDEAAHAVEKYRGIAEPIALIRTADDEESCSLQQSVEYGDSGRSLLMGENTERQPP